MKINREQVYNKYNGLCGYSETPLEDDWQVDHMIPKNILHWLKSDKMRDYLKTDITDINDIRNLVPCQKIINHYKRSLSLEEFRTLWLGGLHKRLDKPKNPRTEKSRKTKEYRLKVASYFGITPDKPFSGVFYFETLKEKE
jgi:hypothetical protein